MYGIIPPTCGFETVYVPNIFNNHSIYILGIQVNIAIKKHFVAVITSQREIVCGG